LSHALTVGLGILRGLGKENGVSLGCDTELVVKGVMPDLLHVIPVGNDSMLDGVLEGENSTLGLCLISYVCVTLLHTHHDARLTGATNERWKDGTGGIVSSESGFAHSRSVINYEGSDIFFVGHDDDDDYKVNLFSE
jgi:hypothetical protein